MIDRKARNIQVYRFVYFAYFFVSSNNIKYICFISFFSSYNFITLQKYIALSLDFLFPLKHFIKLRGLSWLICWITRWRWSSDPAVSLSLSIFSYPLPCSPKGWLACLDIVRVKVNLIPAGWFHSRLCPSRRADLPHVVIAQQSSASHPLFVPHPLEAGRVLPAKLSRRWKPSPNPLATIGGEVKFILFRHCESK